MKTHRLILTVLFAAILTAILAAALQAEPPSKPKGPPPGGRGGPSHESPDMQALLKSFNLTAEQQAKYDAARKATGEQMRAISVGKRDGTMPMDEVLKKALASHKALNAAVKEILSPEQYDKWLPLRESDHHKIAQAHKARDEAAAKANADAEKPAGPAK
jgi:hypothetical protein